MVLKLVNLMKIKKFDIIVMKQIKRCIKVQSSHYQLQEISSAKSLSN